jgi:hypothetical protein
MSDNSYKFLYWDEPDSDESESKNNPPKTFSDSLEDDE